MGKGSRPKSIKFGAIRPPGWGRQVSNKSNNIAEPKLQNHKFVILEIALNQLIASAVARSRHPLLKSVF